MYQVISSGSKGNAVLYFNSILVDCGISFTSLKPNLYNIQIVLLTHEHGDHFNLSTIKKLIKERPTLRIGCGEWLADKLQFVKNLDVLEIGSIYDYGIFKISSVKLYHDVPNCGYRIFKDGKKIFHATDTSHLEGITAKYYDLYAIESNYDEETVYDTIHELESKGEFAHQHGSINSHLSEQQTRDFIFKNRGKHSQVLRLHESSTSL
jgi:L-ascorbate metabolism protein UlaG (beta-lactamase superfamily)